MRRMRLNTEAWAGPLSKHVGSGGRFLRSDVYADARMFEGEVSDDSFHIQRIHYQGQSHGPRLWTIGHVQAEPEGTHIRFTHKHRTKTWVGLVLWTGMLLALSLFAVTLGGGPNLLIVLLATVGIFTAGLLSCYIGFRMECGYCSDALHRILSIPPD